ncbi:hypothetical protein AB688_03195 [Pseudomonas putida]|nr:hypothetical protein AB688_03195 [Pseudomonas putida]
MDPLIEGVNEKVAPIIAGLGFAKQGAGREKIAGLHRVAGATGYSTIERQCSTDRLQLDRGLAAILPDQ